MEIGENKDLTIQLLGYEIERLQELSERAVVAGEKFAAENRRLREALEDIANKIECSCRYCVGCNEGSKMRYRAEAALEGTDV